MKRKIKRERKKAREHQFRERAGWSDGHHLNPRTRGGQSIGSNILQIDAYRHTAWHLLFKELTLEEIILLLVRIKKIKDSQKIRRIIF